MEFLGAYHCTNRAETYKRLVVVDKTAAYLKEKLPNTNLKNTALVSVTHTLESMVPMFQSLVENFALQPDMIFPLGKIYSNSLLVKQKMYNLGYNYQENIPQQYPGGYRKAMDCDLHKLWLTVLSSIYKKNIQKILLLDDDGGLTGTIPPTISDHYEVSSVTQTTYAYKEAVRGLLQSHHTLPFPIVNVAESALKKQVESTLIAETITQLLKESALLSNGSISCGVIGRGAIGDSIVKMLLELKHKVFVYDVDQKKLKQNGAINLDSLKKLFEESKVIIACTPGNPFAENNVNVRELLNQAKGNKYCINCASGDYPFLSFLQDIHARQAIGYNYNPLSNICYQTNQAKIEILNGGFPVNFNNSGQSVSAKKIAITRAMLAGALIQAHQTRDCPMTE